MWSALLHPSSPTLTAMLRLLSGVEGLPETILVAWDSITVGRNGGTGVGAHVCLQHPNCPGLLSRQHASIKLGTNGHLLVTDMGSMNGTFVCQGPAQPAHRIPAKEGVSLCPGSILYFGAREQVFGRDGVACPNPFIYQFIGRPLALLDMEGQVDQHLAATSPQPRSTAAAQAPQQQTEQAKQQSQQLEPQPPQLSVRSQSKQPSHALDAEAPASKRQKLSDATATPLLQQEACEFQQQTLQQQVMHEPSAAVEHGPPSSSVSVEVVEDAAAPASYGHPQQLPQHGLMDVPGMVASSEPEVVQQLRQPLQEAEIPAQQPDQDQPPLQQRQQQQQQPHLSGPESAAYCQHQLSGHDPQPLAERDPNIPLHPQLQQTPASSKEAAATATGKAAAAAKHSPSMRVSASTLECAICRDVMVAPHTLGCGHTFCGPCLQLWLERHKPTCPTCRTPVTQAPVLQLILNSLVSEAGLDQGSEGLDRAARLDAWNAVKDVTLAQWNKRFNNNSNGNKQAKQGSRTPRQQATVAAGDRPATRQQARQAPAGVVSLLPGRPSHVTAAGAATGRHAHQTASRDLTAAAVAAAVAAARASQAATAAAAAVVNRAAGRSASRRRSRRRRGSTVAVAAVAANGSNRAGNNSSATNAVVQQHRARTPARRQPVQWLQWPPQHQQQQTRPRVARQAPIDSFLRRGVPVAQ